MYAGLHNSYKYYAEIYLNKIGKNTLWANQLRILNVKCSLTFDAFFLLQTLKCIWLQKQPFSSWPDMYFCIIISAIAQCEDILCPVSAE